MIPSIEIKTVVRYLAVTIADLVTGRLHVKISVSFFFSVNKNPELAKQRYMHENIR